MVEALVAEVSAARGANALLDAAVHELRDELAALCLQGALLLRYSPTEVAEAFISSRLGPDAGRTFGTLPKGISARRLVARITPQ